MLAALVAALAPAALVAVLPSAARAAYGPRELLAARRQLYDGAYAWSDQHQVMRVTMVDAREGRQERTIELYERRYPGGARKSLLVFLAPDNVKGTAVLAQQRAHGTTERWLYLPRQKRARRFAGPMSNEGVMGTDLTPRELDLMHDTLRWTSADVRPGLRGPEPVEGTDAYALEALSVPDYARVVLWVGAADLVLRRLELYGTDAAILKRIRQSQVRFVGRVPVPARVEVENPGAGTRSTFEVVEVEFDVGFPDDVFSLPLLASPAR
jgi:hypothetical protein